jgi:hypothetical protein
MSLPEGFSIRRASTADLEILIAHRRNMFLDMGASPTLECPSRVKATSKDRREGGLVVFTLYVFRV